MQLPSCPSPTPLLYEPQGRTTLFPPLSSSVHASTVLLPLLVSFSPSFLLLWQVLKSSSSSSSSWECIEKRRVT